MSHSLFYDVPFDGTLSFEEWCNTNGAALFINDEGETMKTRFLMWMCRRVMPKSLIYFAANQLGAEVTTGKYGTTVVPELKFMDALKRFSDDHHVHVQKGAS